MTEMNGPVQWIAKWIWASSKNHGVNEFAYFRRSVHISEAPVLAKAHISAHHHFEIHVNGQRVGGYISPAPSHPQRDKLFLTHDIREFLVKGENVICAVVHYIGGHGQNYVDAKPGFLMQVDIKYPEGEGDCIHTDAEWKCLTQTPYENGTEFQQSRRLSCIERFDAGKEPKGWLTRGYDDHGWENAVMSPINFESWKLHPQGIPEGEIDEIVYPGPCGIQRIGWQVFDAGRILTGWPRIELPGKQGMRIRLRYSEDINVDGSVRHNVCNEASEHYHDEYIMQGEAVETWEPRFSYKAFRYIEITGYSGCIESGQILIIAAHTQLDCLGRFHCSSLVLNKIFDACIRTQKNGILGLMGDCPHREQAQYLADADLQMETFGYNFQDRSIPIKVLNDFRHAQQEDGTFPFVFPSNTEWPGLDLKIPEWDLHYVSLLWKTFQLYGDTCILKEFYPVAKKMIDHYLSKIDRMTGLIPKSGGWHISDWPYPDVDHEGEYLTVQNCEMYKCLLILGQIARMVGAANEGEAYLQAASGLRGAIVERMYDKTRKVFMDCLGSRKASQAVNVLAFHYGVVPHGDRTRLLKHIVGQGMQCSILASLFLLRTLFENDEQDRALSILMSEEYPGWGYMIRSGYQTTWEGFQDRDSHSHAWSSYPARILMEYVVGIQPASPGFDKVNIKPFISPALEYAEAEVTTIHGSIYAKWYRERSWVHLVVKLPDGIEGTIHMPRGRTIRIDDSIQRCVVFEA